MKKIGLLSVMAVTILAVAYGQGIKDSAIPNPVRASSRARMIASLERSSVRIGDPINLHLRLKNVSSGPIEIVRSGFNDDDWLIVTDASGMEVPRTEKGDRWRQRSRSQVGTILYALSPGAEESDGVIDVTELYRLDRPGSYFLRIARRIGLPPGEPLPKTAKEGQEAPLEEAVSDLIPFTILPKGPHARYQIVGRHSPDDGIISCALLPRPPNPHRHPTPRRELHLQ